VFLKFETSKKDVLCGTSLFLASILFLDLEFGVSQSFTSVAKADFVCSFYRRPKGLLHPHRDTATRESL